MNCVDSAESTARLRETEVYTKPADDVDGFASQVERSVTDVLDNLAQWQQLTKLSQAAVDAKRRTRHLERRWKRTGVASDRMAYRAACRTENAEITAHEVDL